MTIQETGKIMDILSIAYPNFYKSISDEEKFQASALWAEMFMDEPVELVAGAVKRLIASDTKGFPPVIGQVKEQLFRLVHPEEMTEAEAWATVRRAIRHTGAEETFAALPPELRAMVGSPNQLRDWGRMDEDTVNSVVASNFMRSFRARSAAQKEYQKLPADLRAISQKLADGMGIGRLTEGDKNDD